MRGNLQPSNEPPPGDNPGGDIAPDPDCQGLPHVFRAVPFDGVYPGKVTVHEGPVFVTMACCSACATRKFWQTAQTALTREQLAEINGFVFMDCGSPPPPPGKKIIL